MRKWLALSLALAAGMHAAPAPAADVPHAVAPAMHAAPAPGTIYIDQWGRMWMWSWIDGYGWGWVRVG